MINIPLQIEDDLIPLKDADYILESYRERTLQDEDVFRIGSEKYARYDGRKKAFYVYSKKEYLGKCFLKELLSQTSRFSLEEI